MTKHRSARIAFLKSAIYDGGPDEWYNCCRAELSYLIEEEADEENALNAQAADWEETLKAASARENSQDQEEYAATRER